MKEPSRTKEKDFIEVCVKQVLEDIENKGYVERKSVVTDFKSKLPLHNLTSPQASMVTSFQSALTYQVSKSHHIKSYSIDKYVKSIGTLYYDESRMHLESVQQIYEMMYTLDRQKRELNEYQACNLKETDITNMLLRQVELFTSAGTHPDYRQILSDSGDLNNESKFLLDKYLHQPLVDFIGRITKCGKFNSKSNNESHKDTLKIQMVIAIMCNMMSRNSLLVQNLIGLELFAGGVKDKVCWHNMFFLIYQWHSKILV